jgi:hypothetical protein
MCTINKYLSHEFDEEISHRIYALKLAFWIKIYMGIWDNCKEYIYLDIKIERIRK